MIFEDYILLGKQYHNCPEVETLTSFMPGAGLVVLCTEDKVKLAECQFPRVMSVDNQFRESQLLAWCTILDINFNMMNQKEK